MNSVAFDWTSLLTGVQFLLGLQLIVVAVLHFTYRYKRTSIPLAFLCLIHGLWFFKRVFIGYWEHNPFLFLLIGPGKPIFVGALFLFYNKLYTAKLQRVYVLRRLIIPSAYYILILLFRYVLVDYFSPLHSQYFSFFFTACVFFIFWHYFLLTRREIRTNLRKKLIPKAYKKAVFLFYSLYFFLLQVPIWDMLRHMVMTEVLSADIHSLISFLYYHFFLYVGEYATYMYLHILGYMLFLYAVSEITYFKRMFLPENIWINPSTVRNKETIDQLIRRYFEVEKIFKNPDCTIEFCAATMQVTKKELLAYFNLRGKGSFKDFVTQWRVEEFKTLVSKENFQHYNLVGLAKECGFKSKSTFFRVFKNLEGITPNEYKQTK